MPGARFLWLVVLMGFAEAPSFADGPGYAFAPEPRIAFRAPNGKFSILAYYPVDEKSGVQIWIKPRGGLAYPLPERRAVEASPEDAGEWRLTPDGRWLLCIHRAGSGTNEIRLYRCSETGRIAPGPSFDALAYKFYATHSGLARDQLAIFHCSWSFVRWEGRNRVVLNLFGQSTMSQPMWVTDEWCLGYDFNRQVFFLSADMIDKNQGRLYPVPHPVETSIDELGG